MGRPLPRKIIGKASGTGKQLIIRGILNIGTGIEQLYIRKQVNTGKFLCADPTDTRVGYITLQNATPIAVGQGRIQVSPFGASVAAAHATMKAVARTMVAPGTGYTANDVLTVVGGTHGPAATITVNTVNGSGVILTSTLTAVGSYTALPANPVAVTGGTGTGATFNISWGVATVVVDAAGTGYEDAPAVSFTGGAGSGATAHSTLSGSGVGSVTVDTPGSLYTSVPTVVIAGSKEFAKTIELHVVKTFEDHIYKYNLNVPAASAGEADIESA